MYQTGTLSIILIEKTISDSGCNISTIIKKIIWRAVRSVLVYPKSVFLLYFYFLCLREKLKKITHTLEELVMTVMYQLMYQYVLFIIIKHQAFFFFFFCWELNVGERERENTTNSTEDVINTNNFWQPWKHLNKAQHQELAIQTVIYGQLTLKHFTTLFRLM